MNNKTKLYFASFLFKKTSNLKLKAEHLLYNEKLYTTQIEFDIPSVFAILSTDKDIYNEVFNKSLKISNSLWQCHKPALLYCQDCPHLQ